MVMIVEGGGGGRLDRDRDRIGFKLPVQSVPMTTKVVSWNPTHG